jgi:hypothetical protein
MEQDKTVVTLGEDYINQQARVRELRQHGIEIGPAGAFYVAVCDDLLRRADAAAISGDLVDMICVYKEMKELS